MLTESDSRSLIDVEVAFVSPSPTNPRKTFPKGPLDELAASIKERGVREPVTVRPKPAQTDCFELVHGERRWRASKVAGKTVIPAILIEATDQEVLELQLLEHASHEDLHPTEEGAAFDELHTKFGVPVASIAKRISKSTTYVYGRLSLCKLEPDPKKAFVGGKLTLEAAQVLARVPAKLQKQALEEMIDDFRYDHDGAPVSGQHAADLVEDKYMRKLADAPFDRGDGDLVKKAGPCTTCPKRTGCQAELFADIKSPDLCSDPGCYAEKVDAWWGRKTAEAATKGQTVLSEAQSKKVIAHGHVLASSAYVDLKDKNFTDSKMRTWEQILGKNKPPVVLARDEDGKVHMLVAKEEAGLALKKVGGAAAKLAPEKRQADPHTVKMQREAAIRRAAADNALGLLVVAAARKGPTVEVIRVVVYGLIREVWADRIKAVVERRGLTPPKDPKKASYSRANSEVLEAAAKKMPMGDLLGLAVELVASRDAYSVHRREDSDALAQACAELKVDWAKCETEAKQERAAKEKAKKAPKADKPAKKTKVKR